MRKTVILFFALVATLCRAQEPISDSTSPSSYGACIMHDGSVSGINMDERFAMHSVMKFPQALYVADYLSRKGLALDVCETSFDDVQYGALLVYRQGSEPD